ncbi:inorganic diphosphatase, partial [Spongiibacter marinus]
KEPSDLPELLIQQIEHFFENYKDLEKGKWVKVDGWAGSKEALAEVEKAAAAYKG